LDSAQAVVSICCAIHQFKMVIVDVSQAFHGIRIKNHLVVWKIEQGMGAGSANAFVRGHYDP
jgi:hypothetical protein